MSFLSWGACLRFLYLSKQKFVVELKVVVVCRLLEQLIQRHQLQSVMLYYGSDVSLEQHFVGARGCLC